MGRRSRHRSWPQYGVLRVLLGGIKAPDRAVRVQATPTWWEVLVACFFCGGTYVPVCAAANGHSFMIHSFAQWGKGLHRARRERSPHGRTPPAFSPPGVSLHHTDVHSSTFWSTRAHICICFKNVLLVLFVFVACSLRASWTARYDGGCGKI